MKYKVGDVLGLYYSNSFMNGIILYIDDQTLNCKIFWNDNLIQNCNISYIENFVTKLPRSVYIRIT
jgi:hypothetical protein